MKNFTQNISIKNKLLLISLIPLAALFYFLAEKISTQISTRNKITAVQEEVLIAERVSEVVHQLQQERGYSIGYSASFGREEKSGLFLQRDLADKAINNLSKLLDNNKSSYTVLQMLDTIPALRSRINNYSLPSDSIRYHYASIIIPMIDEINRSALKSVVPEVKNLLTNHVSLLYAKEYFALVRNNLKQAFISKGFRGKNYAEFASLNGIYKINLEKFRKNLNNEQVAFFDRKMSNPAIPIINAIIDSAYNNPSFTQFKYTLDDLWVNGISVLNTLKEVEDKSILDIRLAGDISLAEINKSVTRSFIIAFGVMVFIIFLLYVTIRSITMSVRKIKEAAERITNGDVDMTLSIDSKDEIGELAHSFSQLINVSKEYANAAETFGKGDYTPTVNVRSNVDRLGISLNNMKTNLLKLSKENEIRTWLLTGHRALNDKMRGEKDFRELAQEIITQLTTYLNAQIGAIYLSYNGNLNLTASYAFHYRKENINVIKPGEGLVGQAALEKQPITFANIPDDYVKINSGLGNTAPRNILVFPFFYEGHLKGVIELGTVHEFSELHMQFLEMAAENIGIAFNTAQSRMKLKELLDETQRQSEELETQQEELRQINEELQEKTNLLEKSEAELKTQQEELQQTNEELEEKANLLEEQKESLEIAKMEIENKARELELNSKYKSEFLANMSHELRTPLNSILILAQLLSENKNKTLSAKEVQFAQNIYNSGNDLLRLIDEILDLSKVESGKMELDISVVEITEFESKLGSMFGEMAKNKAIDFDMHFDKQLEGHLLTDQHRLEQILRNFLSNAFKFTDKGGSVKLRADLAQPNRSLRNRNLRQLEKIIAFSVTDTGIGIPENKLSVVFEAFQQADGSTKRKYGGTGLGLSISRELASALGGEIHVQSKQGEGSMFTLYLPLKYEKPTVELSNETVEVKKVEQETTKQNGSNAETELPVHGIADDRHSIQENDKVILIIEDDQDFAYIILNFSRERGYKGIIAHQGNVGLSLARHYRPDAIILDMKLPVMDGAEVLKQLKNDPNLRHIPVQILSGYDYKKESLEQGAFNFMKKPLTKQDLQVVFEQFEEFVNKKLKKLLIVEDDKLQNSVICELIGDGDVKCVSAYSGEEAYQMIQNESVDCIIIDLGLPGMSGFDLLEKIKSNESINNIPVIVYTARDLTKEESNRLSKLASSVVLKTANSKERLLDETTLFLHRVESRLPKEKQQIIRKLHRTDEILKNKKVLVVDDDMRNIYSLTNVLEAEGMKCVTAENGKVALKILRDNPDVDLILMDVMMPEMDGYESTKEIRSMDKFAKTPVIALTAKAMKGDREKCLEAGMSDYISKPVHMEQLLSLMRVWLYK